MPAPYVEIDPSKIYHLRDPRLPQFGFEWHPRTQKVYRVDFPGEWRDGEFVPDSDKRTAKGFCISEHTETHGAAYGHVQTFCRGYLLAVEHSRNNKLGGKVPESIRATDPCPVR